jgi:FkbM family methyltransferase
MLRKEVGYKGLIISFEPCAESFQLLKSARSKDKNWRGYQFGLGTKDGTAQLNRYNERGFNSLLNLREETAAPYGVEVSSQVENVQIRRLDTVWDEIMTDIRSPNVFLKTDTQGMDIPIVSGAASRLHCVYGIQCELPTIEMYEGMVPLPEALQFLRNLGYLPAGFYPQAERAAFGVAPEFDVVFKRPKSQAFLTRTRDCPSV